MKRLVDILGALTGLVLASPVLLTVMLLVWLQDFRSPLYTPLRAGQGGRTFRMIKLRSMVMNADRKGGSSTAANDPRITPVGRFIRRCKLDELTQLWNVLVGDMSLVGPRPNLKEETDLYTSEERKLLSVRPGITDFSSIVFSDEGEILRGKPDPDLAYNQLIRPWKSRLGIFYVEKRSFAVDVKLIAFTLVALASRRHALDLVQRLLIRLGADKRLVRVASRSEELTPYPPPGAAEIVGSRV